MLGHLLLGEENGLWLLVHSQQDMASGGDVIRTPDPAGKGDARLPPFGRTQGSWEMGSWGCALWGWAVHSGAGLHGARGARGPPSWVPDDSAPPTLQVCSSSWCRTGARGAAASGDSDVGVSLSMWL